MLDLDDITLPFVIPAPKYRNGDRAATARAMREAWDEIAVLQREASLAVSLEEPNEDIPDEEEELFEASDYVDEEREEEKIYAEMLWSQVDSSENWLNIADRDDSKNSSYEIDNHFYQVKRGVFCEILGPTGGKSCLSHCVIDLISRSN